MAISSLVLVVIGMFAPHAVKAAWDKGKEGLSAFDERRRARRQAATSLRDGGAPEDALADAQHNASLLRAATNGEAERVDAVRRLVASCESARDAYVLRFVIGLASRAPVREPATLVAEDEQLVARGDSEPDRPPFEPIKRQESTRAIGLLLGAGCASNGPGGVCRVSREMQSGLRDVLGSSSGEDFIPSERWEEKKAVRPPRVSFTPKSAGVATGHTTRRAL